VACSRVNFTFLHFGGTYWLHFQGGQYYFITLFFMTFIGPILKMKLKFYDKSYVYWTVHHLDSWIKRDQLDVTCFIISLFNVQHVSGVNASILRSLRLICWVISWVVLLWFDVCWCYVVVWLGWCFRLHTDTTPLQPNHNVTPTNIVPEQYNPWNNSTNKSQAPEDGCINIRNMLSIK